MPAGERERARLDLRYDALVIRVESEESGHLAWLEEFLTPQFEVVAGVLPHRTVRLVADSDRYADTLRRGPDPGGDCLAAFVMDSHVVTLPLWRGIGEARVLREEEFGAFYAISADGSAVEIVTPEGNSSVRNALMRVVRELAMAGVRRTGGLLLHAAAVALAEQVMVIAGPKQAGKTTLLVHILGQSPARFVANDRVVVSGPGPGATARGLPTIVKLRRETADWFPGLRDRLLASPFHHRRTLAEARGRAAGVTATAPDGYWSLSPAQFCALLGVDAIPSGRLGAALFPRMTRRPGTLALRALRPEETEAALADSEFPSHRDGGPGSAGVDPWTGGAAPLADDPASARRRWREVANSVPGFVCELGAEAYRDPTSAQRLLDRVGA